ncbi:MAG: MBL fold metallo-hydrolase [Clostridiaceae bacterium]|nr:MBL fold metallo-hydrolase [Clostridiaceae bacterium]
MKKIILVVSWIFSILFLLIGFTFLFSSFLLPGLILMLIGAILLPPITSFINKQFKITPKWWMKDLAVFILFIIFLATIPDNEYKAGDKIVNSDMETLVEPVQNPGTGASNVEINDKSHTQPNNDKEKNKTQQGNTEKGRDDKKIEKTETGTGIGPGAGTAATGAAEATATAAMATNEANETNESIGTIAVTEATTTATATNEKETPGTLVIHFIDVGQADSILINTGSAAMLIDAGNNADAELVVNYIKEQGIKEFEYIIATHPHEDHIGGLDAVINTFDVKKIIMPKAQSSTRTFEDLLIAISNKGLKITSPAVGTRYSLGEAEFTILAPNSQSYGDTNDYSVVIKILFDKTTFLLTGDAGVVSEREMLSKGFDLKSDLLKVAHHGSRYSNSAEFLKAVSPTNAIISVGKDNPYGHPAPETIERLVKAGVQVYRTDESGTIVVTSDGETIKIDKKTSPIKEQAPPKATTAEAEDLTQKEEPVQQDDEKEDIEKEDIEKEELTGVYIGNKNTKKFHKPSCNSLPAEKNRVYFNTKEEAVSAGYQPCKICEP